LFESLLNRNAMAAIETARLIIHSLLLIFTTIVFGIACFFTSLSAGFDTVNGPFPLAVSLITYAVVISIRVLEHFTRTTIGLMVAVELVWTGILGIFWLSVAGSNSALGLFFCDFSFGFDDFSDNAFCGPFRALMAFSWLNWLLLWGWSITLFILAVIAAVRGNKRVWVAPTTTTTFLASSGHKQEVGFGQPQMGSHLATPYGTAAPQPQYGYPPVGHPTADAGYVA